MLTMYFLYAILAVQIHATLSQTQATNFEAKLCVVDEKFSSCLELKAITTNAPFQCVAARDRIECLQKVENGEADITTVPSNEAYAASVHMEKLIPLLEEQTNEGNFVYESVAVVKNDTTIKSLNDLKDKKSCFTGYKRTAGWDIPIAFLTSKEVLPCNNDIELADVSSFFHATCIPGNWSRDANENNKLKSKYKNLCQLCNQTCNSASTDRYLGYEGALKCLMEKSADIAFTKYSVVKELAATNKSFSDNYRLLCANGSLNSLNNICYWGARPNPLVVSRNDISTANKEALKKKLIEFANNKPRPTFIAGTLLMNETSKALRNISGTILKHLEKANFSITMIKPLPRSCKEKYARFCVNSALAEEKCKNFKIATFAARLRPVVDCIQVEDCKKQIVSNNADFFVAGLKNSYDALTSKQFTSVMTESFTKNNYYLVAVIKSNSTIKTLNDLKGKKSCHSNYNCAASWTIPKGVLLSKKLIKGPACDADKHMTQFFSSSCVPGAPKSLSKLCSLCKDKNKCADSDDFGGFIGALRCLVEGGGDVAFIPNTLIKFMTDNPKVNQTWAKGLKSVDFKLLCTTNEVKSINDFETCNWANIPGKQVLFSNVIAEPLRQSVSLLLIQANYSFGLTSPSFKLFSPYDMTNDMFSNGTTGLIIQNKTSVADILGESVTKLLDSTTCNSAYKIKYDYYILIIGFISVLRLNTW